MEIDKKQEKITEQIRKTEEQLKKLKEKDAEIKKLAKQKREKDQRAWSLRFDKLFQPILIERYGADYFEERQPEEVVKCFVFPEHSDLLPDRELPADAEVSGTEILDKSENPAEEVLRWT
ncbi:MAG: hypothetical protein LUF27_15610 [Lachnospiraceae bacterium]|nr:hypothetical protein [Lachnospiraceae bacterium]